MNAQILLVSFGTTYPDAMERGLERIGTDLEREAGEIPVRQAYTSGMVIRALSEKGIQRRTVEGALREAIAEKVRGLYVVPTHMIPGIEYGKLLETIEKYRDAFDWIRMTTTVLETREDCDRLVPVMKEILEPRPELEYVLMGHGTESSANVRYAQMNEAFLRAGLPNVRIASVEARPDLEDAIRALRDLHGGRPVKVLLHPFMVVAGDHARIDMAGPEDSYMTRLRDIGCEVETVMRGLGEYPQFRRIYTDKFLEMRASEA